ncbi:MAG: hypothetical protein CR997_13245 [Acidobacteria bacterium]|nr:MAG: hypothetical protein CR997_13245 [Acidobacteriota bacterium]
MVGCPAYYTEHYHPSESKSDLRTAVKLTLDSISWPIKKELADTIVASIRFNWRSWGERVTITFLPNNAISVTSKCILPTQCFDWGKNKANVEKFLTVLKKKTIE